MYMADQIGVPVQFESHRNCITNDLYSTPCLLGAIPEMRMCAGPSHYVVDREFWFPMFDRDMGLITRILHRSDSFQGCVAGRQHIQLQLDLPQNKKWKELFKGWWHEVLQDWRKRRHGDCIFFVNWVPPEYAMTGPDVRKMSNR